MRTAMLFAALGLASTAIAQMPIPPFNNTFTASLTRGFWFQVPVGCVITGLSVPNEANQPFQVVEVIDLGTSPPPAYPGTVVGTQLYYNNSAAGGSIIPVAIPLVPGNYVGILGACTPSVGSATSYNSYGTVAGTFNSDVLGIPTTITRFGTQFGIGAGGNQACWSEVAGTISRVNVYLSPSGGGGTFALNASIGAGCVRSFASLYENFATSAAFDLANTSATMVPTGGGYVVLPGISAFIPPSPTATALSLGDDTETAVTLTSPFPHSTGTTSSLTVCSNGYVSIATGNGTGFTPTVATMLAAPQTGWWNWHDYNPSIAGSGLVKFEEVGALAIVTWDGVWDYGGTSATNANTFQFQFDTSSGIVHIVFGAMSALGNGRLVGYSPGGASGDPGNTDLSAMLSAGGVTLGTVDINALALAANTRPLINANWSLTTSNIPATGVFGVEVFGLADPGINDLAFLGMPGCGLRATLDYINVFPVTGATHAYGLNLPNNTGLLGVDLFTTSAVFQAPPVNAFGAITSNAIKGTMGNL